MKPKVVEGQHTDCGGAMVSKLPNTTWPKGAFVETVNVWQQEWFYITEPRNAKWAAAPDFRSGPPRDSPHGPPRALIGGPSWR